MQVFEPWINSEETDELIDLVYALRYWVIKIGGDVEKDIGICLSPSVLMKINKKYDRKTGEELWYKPWTIEQIFSKDDLSILGIKVKKLLGENNEKE